LRDVVEAKNLVRKFLTGHGRRYTQGKSYWTQAHWAWLRKQSFDFEHDNFAYRKLLGLLDFKKACLDEADRHIARLAQSEAFEEPVRRLCSLRGVGIVTAMTLITEVIDFRRFPKASSLMKFLGLVCRENSSGEQRNRSSITKTGNSRCRRVLVEAAWKYAHKPALPKALKERQEGLPGDIVAHSWAAQHRLYHKFWSIAKRKERAKAAVAVARELVGFIWAIMLMDSGKQPCDNNTGTIAAD
jgi:transposase